MCFVEFIHLRSNGLFTTRTSAFAFLGGLEDPDRGRKIFLVGFGGGGKRRLWRYNGWVINKYQEPLNWRLGKVCMPKETGR